MASRARDADTGGGTASKRGGAATGPWDQRAVLGRLRQRRLVDLLRAGPDGRLRARPDATRVRGCRGGVRADRRDLRRGHGPLPGGGGLGELFTDGYQRNFPTEILTGVLLTVLLALAADAVLLGIGRLVTPWERTGARTGR